MQLDEELKRLVPERSFGGDYQLFERQKQSWGSPRKVAVIPVVGTIASGKSREDPLGFAEVAGAETVVRAIRSAQEDPDVAAIVLRVDSGGGDGLASDLMYRAVLEAKKKKPVIASMGDVAASGGYYAAMGAQRIFANPTTITGSIGVFMMKPAVAGLGEKLGVYTETLKRGELSNLMSTWTPWNDQERAAAQKWVDSFYDDFIGGVATSRHLPKERVDQIARGRVWAGATAKELGLVDELGTLQDAVDYARRQAGIPDAEPYELDIEGRASGLLSGVNVQALAGSAGGLSALSPEQKLLLKSLGLPPAVVLEPGAKAMMPFTLEVR